MSGGACAAGRDTVPEIVLGMAAPLVSAVVTWLLRERTMATAPERLGAVLMTAFADQDAVLSAPTSW